MSDQPTRIKDIIDEKSENLKNIQSDISEGTFDDETPKKQNGGARPGAGRPKGSLSLKNRTAIEAKNYFIERVHANVEKLFDAQLDLATGEKVLMVKIKERDGEGKVKKVYHEIVEDKETLKQFMDNEEGTPDMYDELNDEDHYYYLTVRPANNQALQGMLDRAFGKAPEKIEIEGGFFKADQLNIQIIQPQVDIQKAEIIDIQNDTTDNTTTQSETEPSA